MIHKMLLWAPPGNPPIDVGSTGDAGNAYMVAPYTGADLTVIDTEAGNPVETGANGAACRSAASTAAGSNGC